MKFVWGLPKWKFLQEKRAFRARKKSGKVTLPLLKNIPLTPLSSGTSYLCLPGIPGKLVLFLISFQSLFQPKHSLGILPANAQIVANVR